jgi:plasmid stability protein
LEDFLATLNVKNVPEKLYTRLKTRARAQRRSVAQEVIQILSEALESSEPLSVLELRGLGKEIWQDIDPASHVAEERRSWD